jgi:diaminopimelate decarboxylase
MPMSSAFRNRLNPRLKAIASHFGTPFHIYDEAGIRETGYNLKRAFSGIPGFREYFAVKALPNPAILAIMADMGFGFDCSSEAELVLGRRAGASGDDLMFTSNNTTREEFATAMAEGGSILNLDDISLIDKLPAIPELICFRYNPGERRSGNTIIGTPVEAKYGVSHDQLVQAYAKAKALGVNRFGLHTMLASNERDYTYMVQTAAMLLEQVERISNALDVRFEFINIGGGLGIPYRPADEPLNLEAMGQAIDPVSRPFQRQNGYMPKLYMESGRYMTGPTARWWQPPSTAKKSTAPTWGWTPVCPPSCGRACTTPTTTSACRAKQQRTCRLSMWWAPFVKITINSPSSGSCPHRSRRPGGGPRHRRPWPCHGVQLQRQTPPQRTDAQKWTARLT